MFQSILFAVLNVGAVAAILISSSVLTVTTGWRLPHTGYASISAYGCFVLCYFFGQIVFALRNRRLLKNVPPAPRQMNTAIMVVGYREDPAYWKECIRSLIAQSYPVELLLVCVDGEDEDDLAMGQAAADLLEPSGKTWRVVQCRHGGKRSAMAHGFNILRKDYPQIEAVVVSDSDTRFDPHATTHLVSCLSSDHKIGCATGSLRVFNTHVLGRIINARYAFAFDVERASMSAFGVMTCCSGPLSIYRTCLVTDEDFVEEFLGQTCCGKPCCPGDDRHLTCMLLKRGFRSHQTHLAQGHTEAPSNLYRFLKQQLRWIRSFYREMPHQLRALNLQHWTLAVITHYELLYSYILLFWVCWSLMSSPPDLYRGLRATAVSLLLATIRAVFSSAVNGCSAENMWGVAYLPLYFFLILPMKPLALLTFPVQSWSTSARLYGRNAIVLDLDSITIAIAVVLWNGFLVERFVYHLRYIAHHPIV